MIAAQDHDRPMITMMTMIAGNPSACAKMDNKKAWQSISSDFQTEHPGFYASPGRFHTHDAGLCAPTDAAGDGHGLLRGARRVPIGRKYVLLAYLRFFT